jgi:parallel beta-helix repeat protein
MSRITDIADAVWTYSSRTFDGQTPSTSNNTRLDDISYAIWTYTSRNVDKGNKTVTVKPSGQGGTYTSLQAAITGEVAANANLVTGLDGILTIQIEGDWSGGADTTEVHMAGFTADASHYINITTDSANKAGTSLDIDKYYLNVTSGTGYKGAIDVFTPYTRITGLQIRRNSTGFAGILSYASNVLIDSCLVYDTNRTFGAICFHQTSNNRVLNCIAIDCTYGIYASSTGSGHIAYNCTIIGSSSYGIYVDSSNTLTAINCYSGGNTGNDYYAIGTLNLTTCYSEDGSRSTPIAPYSTATFANVTSGSENLALPIGSTLRQVGTNLSADATYPFTHDILGKTRDGYWDIGSARGLGNKTVTVKPTGQGGTYTNLASSLSGEVARNPSLLNMEGILTISIEGDWSGGADTSSVDYNGFTTDANNYVHIISNTPSYKKESTATFRITSKYLRLTGLDILRTTTGETLYIGGQTHPRIDRCVIHGASNRNNTLIIDFNNNFLLPTIVSNCIIHTTSGIGIFTHQSRSNWYNCTVVNCNQGFVNGNNGGRSTIVKNCYVGGNLTADYVNGTDIFVFTTSYSSDGSASTPTAPYSTATFRNVTPGSEDLALVAGSTLIGKGTDLSVDPIYPFNWDITGGRR